MDQVIAALVFALDKCLDKRLMKRAMNKFGDFTNKLIMNSEQMESMN